MIYKSLLASASFVDFVTVDDGASVHDAHLDAALSDYDSEFSTLQLQSGWLDGKRPAEGRTKQMKNVSPRGGFRVAPKPRDLGVKPGSAAPPNLGPRRNQNRPKTQTLA